GEPARRAPEKDQGRCHWEFRNHLHRQETWETAQAGRIRGERDEPSQDSGKEKPLGRSGSRFGPALIQGCGDWLPPRSRGGFEEGQAAPLCRIVRRVLNGFSELDFLSRNAGPARRS